MPSRLTLLALLLPLSWAPTAVGQPDNPVYVDNSPHVTDLFVRALDQVEDNAGESVRLLQQLLDDYGQRLLPRRAGGTVLTGVRGRVLQELIARPELLERYRRIQTPEAQRLFEQGDDAELVRSRMLTTPGLDALLRLAQRALENARFSAASEWLAATRHHPDLLDTRAAHAAWMRGVIGFYQDHPADLAVARADLEELGSFGATLRRDLDDLVAQGPGPEALVAVSPLDRAHADKLDALVAQSIWSIDLDDRRTRRGSELSLLPPNRGMLRTLGGGGSRCIAIVANDTVFLNRGALIHAFDRFTSNPLWPRPFRDPTVGQLESGADYPDALAMLSASDGMLVALTGNPGADRIDRTGEGRLVGLDPETGTMRWLVDLDRLGGDDEYEGLFPHGRPVIHEGSVYCLARKITTEKLMGCYLVALDLETGTPQWIRHLASSGARTLNSRPYSTVVLDNSTLFVASAVGVMAAVEPSTGTIKWLVRSPVPVNFADQHHESFEIGGPVLYDDLFVAISADQRRIEVRERTTGTLVRSNDISSRDRWAQPAYLVADDRYLYAVGKQIRAFELNADEWRNATWAYPPRLTTSRMPPDGIEPGGMPDDLLARTAQPAAINGRTQVTDNALLVPTDIGILVLDCDTGVLTHQIATRAPGNPVAVGGQLIVAMNDGLDAFMSLERAEHMIRQRIAAAPENAEFALSLLRLGLRVNDITLALEAAEIARIAARDVDVPARQLLFALLLELHALDLANSLDEGETLYRLLAAVAETADQRVEHLLAYADWLAELAPSRAPKRYREILAEPLLAATMRQEGGVIRTASAWATRRLGALRETHGARIDSETDSDAAAELARLIAAGSDDASAYAAIARTHPFADAGFTAAARAATILADQQSLREAIGLLLFFYELEPTTMRAGRLLGPAIDLAVTAGYDTLAHDFATTLIARHGAALQLTINGTSIAAAQWRVTLGVPASAPSTLVSFPRIGPPTGSMTFHPGHVIRAAAAVEGQLPNDHTLMLDDGTLSLVRSPALEPEWSRSIDEPIVTLLSVTPEELLLYSPGTTSATSRDPHVIAIDPRSGDLQWTTPRIPSFETDLDRASEPRRTLAIDGLFDPNETVPLLTDDLIVLVQRSGTVAACERVHGDQERWSQKTSLREVHHAFTHPLGIVLVGLERTIGEGTADLRPRVVVLDPDTGKILRLIRPQSGATVSWADVSPLGEILLASASGIEMIDLYRGRRHFSNLDFASMETRAGQLGPRMALIEDRVNSLRTIDLYSAAISDPFDVGIDLDWDASDLESMMLVPDQIIAHYRERLLIYDLDGAIIGSDVIIENRRFEFLLRSDDGFVIVSQSNQLQRGRHRERTYRAYRLSENGRLLGAPIILGDRPFTRLILGAHLIDGALLLSTDEGTHRVPLDEALE